MASHKLVFLIGLLLIALFDTSMAKGKFSKNRNQDVIPKRPYSPPRTPLIQFRKYQIEIHNDLRMFILDSRCYSKDDDLGLHILFPDDQQNWTFRANFMETTKFICRLEWQYGELIFDSFVSDYNFLNRHCGNSVCGWSARQDGVYLTNEVGQYVFYDYWDMLL